MGNAEAAPPKRSETTLSPIAVSHNPGRNRFEMLDGGNLIGQAAYVDRDDDRQRVFYHTVIEEAYGGQGLAGSLAAQALDETVAAGLAIVPVCPFIKKYLGKHPEYSAHVQRPTPAILEFLSAALAQRVRS